MSLELPSDKKQNLQDKLILMAERLVYQGQFLKAGQLYQESGLFKEGALVFFNYADSLASAEKISSDNLKLQVPPIIYKQLYVLAGILTERYHEKNKQIKQNQLNSQAHENGSDRGASRRRAKHRGEGGAKNNDSLASVALDKMLQEENDAGKDGVRLLEQGWRPAEAFHYFILLHKLVKDNKLMVAQHTTQYLIEYEDILGYERVYSLLALIALQSRQMALCSSAFIKLASTLSKDNDQYKNLSETIFSLYNPIDVRPHENLIGNDLMEDSVAGNAFSQQQQNKNKPKYPRCIVSGRPLTACQFWMCSVCRHCAFEEEIQRRISCPLCYAKVE